MLTDEHKGKSVSIDSLAAIDRPRHFLDLLPHAVCLIDGTRQIHDMNRRAEAVLHGGELLGVRAGRLHCQPAEEAAALECYLQGTPHAEGTLALRLGRKHLARDMLVRVEPSALLCSRCGDTTPRFLVHMFMPTDRWVIPEPLLRATYGLTSSEARVIHRLLNGSRVTVVARELGLSAETVRSHLKHVMRKLEVSTQMQLIQVLASGPWR